MKILFLHYYSSASNPAYPQITQATRRLGHETFLGQRDSTGDLLLNSGDEKSLRLKGPKHSASSGLISRILNKIYFLQFILRIRRWIKIWQPEVVQLNRSNLDWYWVLPLTIRKTIFIEDCRQVETPERDNHLLQALKQWWRQQSHVLLIKYLFDQATYLHERGAEKELGPHWSKHASIVPLGVDSQFLTLTHPTPSRPDSNRQSIRTFLYIGGITRYRKLELLIAAAERQKREYGGHFKLVFVGPDKSDGYYQQQVEAADLADVIEFKGSVPYDQVPALINEYDVAIAYVPETPQDWLFHPTLKVLEYLALGAPILASDVPPNRDIIDHYNNGVLVANTAEEWQKGMHQFIENPEFFVEIQNNARHNRHGHDWREIAQQYVQLYQSLG